MGATVQGRCSSPRSSWERKTGTWVLGYFPDRRGIYIAKETDRVQTTSVYANVTLDSCTYKISLYCMACVRTIPPEMDHLQVDRGWCISKVKCFAWRGTASFVWVCFRTTSLIVECLEGLTFETLQDCYDL